MKKKLLFVIDKKLYREPCLVKMQRTRDHENPSLIVPFATLLLHPSLKEHSRRGIRKTVIIRESKKSAMRLHLLEMAGKLHP